jgi:hypothetical protein
MDATVSMLADPAANGDDKSRSTTALVLIGLSLVFLVSLLYRPPDGDYFSVCLFKDLTGLPCPGCGLTHSFCALAKGSLVRAFGYNALGPPFFLIAIGFWFRSAAVLMGKTKPVRAFDRVARGARLARMSLLALLAYGAVRIVYIVWFEPHLRGSAPLLKIITGAAGRL